MRLLMPRQSAAWAVLIAALAVAVPAVGHGETTCTCRYAGQSFALGSCACIVNSSGARVACCDKVLNNSSWTFTGATCPTAELPGDAAGTSTAALPQPPEETSADRTPAVQSVVAAPTR